MIRKTQAIRIADVLLIGPVMIGAGLMKGSLPDWMKASLILFGAATIVYNGMNYVKQQREIEK